LTVSDWLAAILAGFVTSLFVVALLVAIRLAGLAPL
jgi:hypothetical protein